MLNSVAKFFGLLSKKYKIFYVFLFISFGVNILIDLISIAAIFPIIFLFLMKMQFSIQCIMRNLQTF